MFKRTLLISALAIGASLSFTPSFAATTGEISGFSSCTGSACVAQAKALLADINNMRPSPAKDKLLLALVKAIGAVAIANPNLSVALGDVAAGAANGLSPAAAAALPVVKDIVAALQAGTPGDATAAVDGPGLDGPGGDDGGDGPGLGNSSAS